MAIILVLKSSNFICKLHLVPWKWPFLLPVLGGGGIIVAVVLVLEISNLVYKLN